MAVYIAKGSKGEQVKQIQHVLHLIEDGIFGVITEEAVKAFQKANGLKADGIVGNKTWEALFKNANTFERSKRNIKEIIVHCTATPEGREVTVDDVRLWHTLPPPKGRGWKDIGYHYLIYLDGSVHNGRNVNLVGAHCTNHNAESIGVCYVGGCDEKMNPKDTRTKEQKKALLDLLKKLKAMYPKAKIYGHKDFSTKPCPCFDAKDEYKKL